MSLQQRRREMHKSRPFRVWSSGEWCWFWRSRAHLHRRTKASRQFKEGAVLGPARVLLQERERKGDDFKYKAVVWVVDGDQLVRCSSAHLRPVSTAEQTLCSLRDGEVRTFQQVVRELPKRNFVDLVGQPSPIEEDFEEPMDVASSDEELHEDFLSGEELASAPEIAPTEPDDSEVGRVQHSRGRLQILGNTGQVLSLGPGCEASSAAGLRVSRAHADCRDSDYSGLRSPIVSGSAPASATVRDSTLTSQAQGRHLWHRQQRVQDLQRVVVCNMWSVCIHQSGMFLVLDMAETQEFRHLRPAHPTRLHPPRPHSTTRYQLSSNICRFGVLTVHTMWLLWQRALYPQLRACGLSSKVPTRTHQFGFTGEDPVTAKVALGLDLFAAATRSGTSQATRFHSLKAGHSVRFSLSWVHPDVRSCQ